MPWEGGGVAPDHGGDVLGSDQEIMDKWQAGGGHNNTASRLQALVPRLLGSQ